MDEGAISTQTAHNMKVYLGNNLIVGNSSLLETIQTMIHIQIVQLLITYANAA